MHAQTERGRAIVHRATDGYAGVFGMLHDRNFQTRGVLEGLAHQAVVKDWLAVIGESDGGFLAHGTQWQTATVFFAVIDLVAAVGLWLAAPWGAVVWLTAAVSMAVVDVSPATCRTSESPTVMGTAAPPDRSSLVSQRRTAPGSE